MNQKQSNIDDMQSLYPNILKSIECLHRRLLEVIKNEFERNVSFEDIGWAQALLIYDIKDFNGTIAELHSCKSFLGDNIPYNIRKLLHSGYINRRQSSHSQQRDRITLTEKGKNVCKTLTHLYDRHLETIEQVGGVSPVDLFIVHKVLSRLDNFLSNQVQYRL